MFHVLAYSQLGTDGRGQNLSRFTTISSGSRLQRCSTAGVPAEISIDSKSRGPLREKRHGLVEVPWQDDATGLSVQVFLSPGVTGILDLPGNLLVEIPSSSFASASTA